jgi:hypothetical protein
VHDVFGYGVSLKGFFEGVKLFPLSRSQNLLFRSWMGI